jgi:hypothetical protein
MQVWAVEGDGEQASLGSAPYPLGRRLRPSCCLHHEHLSVRRRAPVLVVPAPLYHTEARHPESFPGTVTKKKWAITVHPKLCKLTPICKRAAPFITLCASHGVQWAQSSLVLGTPGLEAPAALPSTVRTDSVQLHVPIEIRRVVLADVGRSAGSWRRS